MSCHQELCRNVACQEKHRCQNESLPEKEPNCVRTKIKVAVAPDLGKVFKVTKETGPILEIYASPVRLDLDAVRVRRARQVGVLIAIDSDVHSPELMSEKETPNAIIYQPR